MNQFRHWLAIAMLFVVMGAQAQLAIADNVLWYKNNLATGSSLPFQPADLTLFDGFNDGTIPSFRTHRLATRSTTTA
jgi:hypothetical protein